MTRPLAPAAVLPVFVVIGSVSIAFAAEPPKKIKEYLERSEALRKQLIPLNEQKLQQATAAVANAKKGAVNKSRGGEFANGVPIFATADDKKERVAELQSTVNEIKKKISNLKDGTIHVNGGLPDNLGVGDIGRIWNGVKIVQIVDKQNALVGFNSGGKDRVTAWLKGFDMSKHADDSTGEVDSLLEVSGTKTYETANGSTRTVFVLESCDTEKLVPYLDVASDESDTKGRGHTKNRRPSSTRRSHRQVDSPLDRI